MKGFFKTIFSEYNNTEMVHKMKNYITVIILKINYLIFFILISQFSLLATDPLVYIRLKNVVLLLRQTYWSNENSLSFTWTDNHAKLGLEQVVQSWNNHPIAGEWFGSTEFSLSKFKVNVKRKNIE